MIIVNGWRKSSYSFSNGNCAEVGQDGTVVLIRDTKDLEGPALAFSAETWTKFLGRLRTA